MRHRLRHRYGRSQDRPTQTVPYRRRYDLVVFHVFTNPNAWSVEVWRKNMFGIKRLEDTVASGKSEADAVLKAKRVADAMEGD